MGRVRDRRDLHLEQRIREMIRDHPEVSIEQIALLLNASISKVKSVAGKTSPSRPKPIPTENQQPPNNNTI